MMVWAGATETFHAFFLSSDEGLLKSRCCHRGTNADAKCPVMALLTALLPVVFPRNQAAR